MKLRSNVLSGLAALSLVAVGAHAQQTIDTYTGGFNAGYSDDDLVLAFYNAGDTSQPAGGDVLFQLGSSANFTNLAAGTYSVAGFNGGADGLTAGFGSTDVNGLTGTTNWAVFGSDTSSNELWLSSPTVATKQSSSAQNTIAGRISNLGQGVSGSPNSDGSATDSSQTTGNFLLPNGSWGGSGINQATVPSSGSSTTMSLFQLIPGNGLNGSATNLGLFTLTDTNGSYNLTFTVAAIPEPSTYAAILGALTLGFIALRRRFGTDALKLV